MLRDADRLVYPAIAATLAALNLQDEDAGIAKLVELYGQALDESEEPEAALIAIGPKLLAALQALQATPAARMRVHTVHEPKAGKLQAIRDAH